MVCNLFECPLNEIIGLTDSAFFDLSTFNQLQINDRRVLDHGEHIESEENNKNITFTVKIAPTLTVNADLFMFQTIITNLINNAIKFTPQDGTISVTAEMVDNHILISITDTGIGIVTAVAETLFTPPKNQPLQNESIITKNTGLGLIVCKEFVTLHNGTIGVSSAINKGSQFWFTLPKNT